MSFQEKKSIVTLFSNVLIFGAYSLYVFFNYQDHILSNPNDFSFWGAAFLIMIPVTIVAHIVIHILFAITNHITTREKIPEFSDELDKLIELRSIRNSHWTFIFGFGVAMATQVMEMEAYIMILTLFGAGLAASVVGDATKFYFYRKGI